MNVSYVVTDALVVKFTGDVEFDMPINPTTRKSFESLEEANTWAAAAVIKMLADSANSIGVKIWTLYRFMSLLGISTMAKIVEFEKAGDTVTIIAMKMFQAANDIRSNDPNLLQTLNYWKDKGIMTQEQIDSILN